MNFATELITKCREYTNMVIGDTRVQIPYKMGGKHAPARIKSILVETKLSGEALQRWASANPTKIGVDCSGLVYFALNEASEGKVMEQFGGTSYAYGVNAASLTDTVNGIRFTKAADMLPGCTIRWANATHILVVTEVIVCSKNYVSQINYTHSSSGIGPHEGYIMIGDPEADLNVAAQIWYDAGYTDADCKRYYNHTILLNSLLDNSRSRCLL